MSSYRPRHAATLLLLLALACAASAAKNVKSTTTTSETETETVTVRRTAKGKPRNFQTAESRVTDLISKLDSVSDHAQRAKNEIHSTLRELWQIVDLLGRDRCGDVVERVRVVQRKAETRVEEQETELAKQRASIFDLTSQLRSHAEETDVVNKQLVEVRARAETAATEVSRLTEKLQRVDAMRDRDGSYKQLSERLVTMLKVATDRLELLQRIIAMLSDDRASTAEWRADIDAIAVSVRTIETSFSSTGSGSEQRLRAQVDALSSELRSAIAARDDVTRNAASLEATVTRLQRVATTKTNSARTQRIVRDEDSGSWTGVLALCVISMCTGAVCVYMFMGMAAGRTDGPPSSARGIPGSSPIDKYTYSPAGRSPGFNHSKSSPMTYVQDSAGKTPRGSGTPRLY